MSDMSSEETPMDDTLRAVYINDIQRAWGWLDHWGFIVDRIGLENLSTYQLSGLAGSERQRVRALAEAWRSWW